VNKVWLFALLFVLSACASTPRFHAVCVSTAPATALLTITAEGRPAQHLLLHAEQQPSGSVWVALDTLGTPLFTARQRGDQLSAEARLGYRGADPLALLWGYQWWLLQETGADLNACAAATGYQLEQSDEGVSVGSRQPRWHWRHTAPAAFELPEEQLRVQVKVIEP